MAERASYADKPWLKSYMLGPWKLAQTLEPYPKVPLFKVLDDAAVNYPGRVAILFRGWEIRFPELKVVVDKLATALADLGIKKGDKVAVILPNLPQFIISDFAVLKTGAVFVPIAFTIKAPELEYELTAAGAETVICSEASLDLVNSLKPKVKIKNVIVTSTEDYTLKPPEVREVPGAYQFKRLIEEHEANPPEVEIDPMEDLAYLNFTGGATGVPKGVMLTHFNRMTNILQSVPWMLTPLKLGVVGKVSVLVAIPLSHAYGYWASETSVYWGMRNILVPDPRDTDTIMELMREHRPYLICCVPTQYMRLVDRKVGRMQSMLLSGTAPLPRVLSDALLAEVGMPVSEAYGLTETSPLTHMNLIAFSKITGFAPALKPGSLGVPIPDTDCKLVDPETREEVPFGEPGEIWVRGPQLMKGYWPTPGNGLVDGWLRTGDIGRMEEDGYFYLEDRIKDMVNVSGLKVYTIVVDDVLFKHPAVAIGCAIGIPDPEIPGSERVKAFIKLKEGYKGKVTAEDIIEHCKRELEPVAVPKFVEFRDDLPLTVTEKIFKRALREEEIKKMKEQGLLKG